MLFDIALVAGGMLKAFLGSLKQDGDKLSALAETEAQKLALSLAVVGRMLKDGDIDYEEAEALLDVQKAASEVVFASLEGIGRVAARRATQAGLQSAVAVVDGAIGLPLVARLVGNGVTASGGETVP